MKKRIIRKKFDLDKCIDLSNMKRLKNRETRIRSKRHLAEIISEKKNLVFDNVYVRLYRSEIDGFMTPNEEFLQYLIEELQLPRNKILVRF